MTVNQLYCILGDLRDKDKGNIGVDILIVQQPHDDRILDIEQTLHLNNQLLLIGYLEGR